MRWFSLLHRWAGSVLALLLAVLGLTGAILVWKAEWVGLPGAGDPLVENVAAIAAITDQAAASGDLSRITFASDEIGLHQLTFKDGGGAYLRQDGTVVDQWASQWERPELWLFDLHHYLFAGQTGETVAGIAGLAGMLFVVTGIILWWRSRRAFRFRLWPRRLAPGPIVSHHRDLGAVAAPLLLVSMATGAMMLFEPVRVAVLGGERRPSVEKPAAGPLTPGSAVVMAKRLYPGAELRRIVLPATPADPIVVRVRQPFEWTPNGRTQLSFEADGRVAIEDAAAANRSASASEKLYPIHSAKVGGWAWKLAMTASGLALLLLGALACAGFWARQWVKGRHRRRLARSVSGLSPAGRGNRGGGHSFERLTLRKAGGDPVALDRAESFRN